MWTKLLLPIIILWMASSANSVEVACEWKYGSMCVISNLPPVTSPSEPITIAGKAANYIDTLTSFVFFNATVLRYVPTKVFTTFTNIVQFAMLNTFTTNLVTDAFVNCGKLTMLAIQAVNIPNVPAGFAQSCSNVGTLMLISDGIQTIDVNAFKGLSKLKILMMADNKLTCIPPDLFQNTPLISEIDFSKSQILAVDSGLFRNLPYLHVINLSKNMLSYLPLFDLTGSAALNGNLAFYLSGNPVNAIQPTFCKLFDSRPTNVVDMFDVPGFKCLPNTAQTVTILKSNCQTTMATYLQKCYANWTITMSFPVPCASSPCALFLWQQFLNYLKTIT
ncbi:hypothetical protein ACKWTF_003421 [Chironomus riparius]